MVVQLRYYNKFTYQLKVNHQNEIIFPFLKEEIYPKDAALNSFYPNKLTYLLSIHSCNFHY